MAAKLKRQIWQVDEGDGMPRSVFIRGTLQGTGVWFSGSGKTEEEADHNLHREMLRVQKMIVKYFEAQPKFTVEEVEWKWREGESGASGASVAVREPDKK